MPLSDTVLSSQNIHKGYLQHLQSLKRDWNVEVIPQKKKNVFYRDMFSHCIWAVEEQLLCTFTHPGFFSATVWEHTVTVFLFEWIPEDYWQPSRLTPQALSSLLHQHKWSQRTCFPMWHWHLAPKLCCSLHWKPASNYTIWLSWLN